MGDDFIFEACVDSVHSALAAQRVEVEAMDKRTSIKQSPWGHGFFVHPACSLLPSEKQA